MLRAAFLAGSAFTKSYVGYVHAVAHSLGGAYNIPHGLANAVLLPVVLEAYGPAAERPLHVVQPVPLHCRIYFPQQMVFGHKTRNAHKLYDVTVHFPSL